MRAEEIVDEINRLTARLAELEERASHHGIFQKYRFNYKWQLVLGEYDGRQSARAACDVELNGKMRRVTTGEVYCVSQLAAVHGVLRIVIAAERYATCSGKSLCDFLEPEKSFLAGMARGDIFVAARYSHYRQSPDCVYS